MGFPLNLDGGFFQRQQDSSYVRRYIDGRATYMFGSDVRAGGLVRSTQVIPSENAAQPALLYSSTVSGGLELTIDTRDNVYNPFSGIQLRNSYEGGDKRLHTVTGIRKDFIQHVELDAWWFQETLRRTVVAVGLHGRELRGGQLDISDLYRLGGANSLRGYREEQFLGTRLGWVNTEFRYSIGRRSFAFAFFDFGYIFLDGDPAQGRETFNETRYGFGIGGRLETGLGIMGVSYALGQGDGFSEGKIHFGLINEF